MILRKGCNKMTVLYLRLKRKVQARKNSLIRLQDVADISSSCSMKESIQNLPLYQITEKDKEYVVLDSFHLIQHIQKYQSDVVVELLGPSETIISVIPSHKKVPFLLVSFVWLILFIGTAMTIINFHYDVSMQEVHQKIHFMFTGTYEKYPLFLQIPYSIGLGIGVVLFLNHWFNKRFNEEPSPLELELFQYKNDVNDYIAHHENDLNDDRHL